jgi:nucleotide-binding universal stress UspA family protein
METIMFKHILVPTDGSASSKDAVATAIRLAQALGAKITVFHVTPEYKQAFESEGFIMPRIPALQQRFEEETAARASTILDEAKHAAAKVGVTCFSAVACGDVPYQMIIAQADKSHCDVIVMASHGRRGLDALLLGSETQKVLTHSKIPVLVCR